MPHRKPIRALLATAALAVALPTLAAVAAPPEPLRKPATPQEQAAITMDSLKDERERRLSAAQEQFQRAVDQAAKERDAAIAAARRQHEAAVAETRTWYDHQRQTLEQTAKAAD